MISLKHVKRYCKDYTKIENYEKAISDTENVWECHHRLEIAPFSGKRVSVEKLIEYRMYYKVQPEALIFLTVAEHIRLHYKEKSLGEEQKRKISESMKGRTHSEETKRKMSEAHKKRI